ncbi:MAG: class I SAM-dependent methyltransferase [Acidobacteria bacterium]|nr:class I SAM-dependent methyltransferase [Acidobacteriota bacterium]
MRLLLVLGLLASCAQISSGWQPRLRRNPVTREEVLPPQPRSASEKLILSVLEEAVQGDEVWANVPEIDGRMLRVLAESTGAKNVVEIGTSTGLSGLWFCMALDRTRGHLTTFEIDPRRAAIAQEHFRKAGVDKLVTLIQGDAHQNVKQLKLPIDIVFIDADKDGYLDYLNKLLPLVRPGGLILAHNVDMVPDYMKAVTASPDLETVVYTQGGGLAVTLKKR